MRTLYAGIDLHSNNSHLAILNQDDKRIFHRRLPNMEDVLLSELEPFKKYQTLWLSPPFTGTKKEGKSAVGFYHGR